MIHARPSASVLPYAASLAGPKEPSGYHVEFGDKADLALVEVCRFLDRDVHLEPVLLAEHKHLLNGEGLIPSP